MHIEVIASYYGDGAMLGLMDLEYLMDANSRSEARADAEGKAEDLAQGRARRRFFSTEWGVVAFLSGLTLHSNVFF